MATIEYMPEKADSALLRNPSEVKRLLEFLAKELEPDMDYSITVNSTGTSIIICYMEVN